MHLCPELKGLDEVGSWDLEPQRLEAAQDLKPSPGKSPGELVLCPTCKAAPGLAFIPVV